MPKKNISDMTNAQIMNDIRSQASAEYKNNIPILDDESARVLGVSFTPYTPSFNEFLSALVNKIAMTIVSNKMARNKLSPFKRGNLPYGKDIEEVFTDLAIKATFDPTLAETEQFKRVIPNTKTIFHRENRRDFYKTTISHDMLKKAFLSDTGLGQMVSSITDSLYSADRNDEFRLMKELMTEYAPSFTNVVVTAPTDTATTKKLAQDIKRVVLNMGFLGTTYNKQAVNTFSDPEDLVLFITPDIAVKMDTELLAFAFNSEKFDTNTQIVTINDFGTNMPKTQAVLVDKSWFQVWDTNYEMTSVYNAQGLYWNYFLHHWQTLSTSQFANAVAFNTP
jgi:hypothetical protein